MNHEKITAAGLKKYLSLFEKSGLYWFCLLLRPCIEVSVSTIDALFYQKIINAVMTSDMDLFKTALWLAGIVLTMDMVKRLVVFIYMYQIRQIMKRLRMRVMTHLFRMPMSYFEGHHTGDSIQKLCFNVEAIKNSLAQTHQQVINPVIIGGAAIIIILALDLRIGLMVLALSAVSVRIDMFLTKPLRGMSVRIQKLLASCTESLTDILAGIDIIKMFPGAQTMVGRYSKGNAEVAASTLKRFRRMSDVRAVEWVFGFLCNIVILIIGVFMSFAGMVDFGTVVAILSLQGMVSYFLGNIGSAWGSLMDSLVLGDRVFEILDQPVSKECERYLGVKEDYPSLPEARLPSSDMHMDSCGNAEGFSSTGDCGIQISGAIFSYDGSERVLDGVDITVDRGKTAALVGESGGGKSTVVKLLLGFYPLESGAVRVLGKPLAGYTPDELRRNIAYVPQDAYLFTRSIRENIRYGRLDASDEEVEQAARRAYAHEFIMSFPKGYDTLVGERGESLSGGQRQRIAIARAFIRNAPILLLDEATSALDTESEQLVQKGIEALMGGCTTLVVAHRLSTIEKADVIYVIESGKVCEKGRHADLMERNGVYRKLVEL